mgnify:CR=1 FL=1
MTRFNAPSSSRTLERMCFGDEEGDLLVERQAGCSGLGKQDSDAHLELRRLERDGEPQPKREMRRSSIPEISFGYVSQVITTCLCASMSVLKR